MEKSTSEIKIKQLADLGHGLIIAQVDIRDIREQDINARIMKPEMFRQLVDNIKKRGQLESLPLCALSGDKIEIISGHHRIRAAKEAGIESIVIILDVSGLNRSQIAAKQLAHNAISGFDDKSTLKEIANIISDVDDMLESYVGKEILGETMEELDNLLSPKVEFDWKNITFTFLPHQIEDMEALMKALETNPDYIGFADVSQYKEFLQTIAKYQKFANVKNLGATIHAMIKNTSRMLEDVGFEEDSEWVQLSSMVGSSAIPKEYAERIKKAVDTLIKREEIDSNRKWEAICVLAEKYLNDEGIE